MKNESGTFSRPVSITVNIEALTSFIAEAITSIIAEGIAQQADIQDEPEYEWSDADEFTVNTRYSGNYRNVHYDATLESPAEDNISYSVDELDMNKLQQHLTDNLPDNVKNFVKITSVWEDEDETDFEEYEPDWDMMPGGHDDYDC